MSGVVVEYLYDILLFLSSRYLLFRNKKKENIFAMARDIDTKAYK